MQGFGTSKTRHHGQHFCSAAFSAGNRIFGPAAVRVPGSRVLGICDLRLHILPVSYFP
jgi:hypothetical protein